MGLRNSLSLVTAFLLVFSLFSAFSLAPAYATITGRPELYPYGGPITIQDPLTIPAGDNVSIYIGNMSISGAQIWLWISPTGGAVIEPKDRFIVGPFYLADVLGATPKLYKLSPGTPFDQEGRTYKYLVGNGWINGTMPAMVMGNFTYWIKVTDVSPGTPSIPSSDVGVSVNRLNFTASYDVHPDMAVPDQTLYASAYATPVGELYNITQDGESVATLVPSEKYTTDGWNWTGFSVSFAAADLELALPAGWGTITVDIIHNDTGVTVYSEGIAQPPRMFIYIANESGFIGPGYFDNDTDYTASVSLGTGCYYNITLNYFPANGKVSIYLNKTLVAGNVALNETGGLINYTIKIPPLNTGDYWLRIIDNHDILYRILVHVYVVPFIEVSPSKGHVGDSFTVIGYNFRDYVGQRVTIWFENNTMGSFVLLANFTVSADTWTVELTVPHAAGGNETVEARNKDGSTVIASTLFEVQPKLVIIPDTFSNDGSLVHVIGTGFRNDVGYTPNIDNRYLGVDWWDIDMPSSIYATEFGDINLTFVAAGFTPGLHVFSMYPGGELEPVYVLFTVTGPSPDTETILDAIDSSKSEVLNAISGLSDQLGDVESSILSALGGLSDQIEGISDQIDTAVAYLDGKLDTVIDTVNDAVDAINDAVDALNTVAGNLPSIVSESVSEGLSDLADMIESGFSDVSDSLGSIQTTLDGIVDSLQAVQSGLSNVQSGLSDLSDMIAKSTSDTSSFLLATLVLVIITLIFAAAAAIKVFRG